MIDATDPTDEQPQGPRRRSRVALVVGMACGAITVVLVTLVVWAVLSRDTTTPLLSRADYEAALERWQKNGPASYDLDLTLGGGRPGPVHVEVRDRRVTRMTRDGVVPKQERTWEAWTVPGMFDTLDLEIDMAADPVANAAAPAGSQVIMRASFDTRYGYPAVFRRALLRPAMPAIEVSWEVTKFEVVE